jgi:AAA ATPase containing von Willebrand factor type A (vWA) domain
MDHYQATSNETFHDDPAQAYGRTSPQPPRALNTAQMSDDDLMQELRRQWGFHPEEPVLVVGSLEEVEREDLPSLYFLKHLEHPKTSVGLVYPEDEKPAGAFIPPPEFKRIKVKLSPRGEPRWAIAQLQLSPKHKRKHPFTCEVKSGTLRILDTLPEDWIPSIYGETTPRMISAAAIAAIKQNAQEETYSIHSEMRRIESLLDEELQKLSSVRKTVSEQEFLLSEVEGAVQHQYALMNSRFQLLDDLLERKGQRLLALDLVDETDLAALRPEKNFETIPSGHDFQKVLGGSYDRLVNFLQARLHAKGLLFNQAQLRNVLALIRTNDLFILAGDSGSGKTSLIKAVAEALGGHCEIVPIKPNWTGPEDLLGNFNPIDRVFHPSPFLNALRKAQDNPNLLHVIVLDEMNLARVEHYFADFLSKLEERNVAPEITLYSNREEKHSISASSLFLAIEEEVRKQIGLPDSATIEDILKNDNANRLLRELGGFKDGKSILEYHAFLRRSLGFQIHNPTSIKIPANVRIVGAINIDETTHYLSPKVLDRIHVLRFRNPVLQDTAAIEAEIDSLGLDLKLPVVITNDDLGTRGDYPPYRPNDDVTLFLVKLVREYLDPLGIEFGFRAIRQCIHYIEQASIVGINPMQALDNVLSHKLLPKLIIDTTRHA